MTDPNNTNTQNTQPAGTGATGTNGGNQPSGKTFTQADMDNLAGKIRSEEKAKVEDLIKQAIAEHDRQAQLSQEEKDKEAKAKREKELAERENSITIRERKLQAQEILAQSNIPIDLVDFVVDLDENKMKSNIERFAKSYNKSIEAGVFYFWQGQKDLVSPVGSVGASATSWQRSPPETRTPRHAPRASV